MNNNNYTHRKNNNKNHKNNKKNAMKTRLFGQMVSFHMTFISNILVSSVYFTTTKTGVKHLEEGEEQQKMEVQKLGQ